MFFIWIIPKVLITLKILDVKIGLNIYMGHIKVPFTVLRYFMHKASITSINVHSADWLMGVFVNELAPPNVHSQQGQCMQQCQRIMKESLV